LYVAYEIIGFIPPIFSCIIYPFTMRRPPYIILERPNHLRDIWDKLRIPLLQFGCPLRSCLELIFKSNQPQRLRGFSLDFLQQTKFHPKKAISPSKGTQSTGMLP
jgi:hypothetical protein